MGVLSWFFILFVIGTSIWAAVDAGQVRERISAEIEFERPAVVLLGCLLLWILFFPIYLARRSRVLAEDAERKAGRGPDRNITRDQRISERERVERMEREKAIAAALVTNAPRVADRLADLDGLKTRELITAEEYAKKRAEILASV